MANLDQDIRDSTAPVWDMSQERLLMEQIVGQRFNFMFIFISITFLGAVNSRIQLHLQIILIAGAIMNYFIAAAIRRTAKRLDYILNYLKTDNTHPYTIVSEGVRGKGIRRIMYIYIPWFFCALITIGAILSLLNLLTVAPSR